MLRQLPSSITIEEAVAEMVNMDYIPTGFTLLDMTAAFQEEAEVDYENARIDQLPEDQITSLNIRMNSCRARHELAQLLLESLQNEVDNPKGSITTIADDASSQLRLTFDSVSYWAADRYGIGISMYTKDSNTVNDSLKNVSWDDITIKIWKDHKIGFSSQKGKFTRSHFRKIGLMGKAKNTPNQLGIILIGLSKKKIFPIGVYANGREKTAISKLRRVLYEWTGLSEEPFKPYNQGEGWIPKFTLIYDVKNADERAKEKAIHVSYDEAKHIDDTYE